MAHLPGEAQRGEWAKGGTATPGSQGQDLEIFEVIMVLLQSYSIIGKLWFRGQGGVYIYIYIYTYNYMEQLFM